MRIYVIGPVTGKEDDNRPKFEEAAQRLYEAGYTALIPHWFIRPGTPWRPAMKRSLEILALCDGIAALEGFGSSKGARIEADLAVQLEMPVKSVDQWIGAEK